MATVAFFATVHNDDAARLSLIMRQPNAHFPCDNRSYEKVRLGYLFLKLCDTMQVAHG